MSAKVLAMQSIESYSRREVQPDPDMLTDMSHLYTTPNAWSTMQPTNNFSSGTTYMPFHMPFVASTPNGQTAYGAFGANSHPNIPIHHLSHSPFKAANTVAYDRTMSETSQGQTSVVPVEYSPSSRNDSTIEPLYLKASESSPDSNESYEQTGTSPDKKPAKVGRKRKMEQAQPGSDRAVYLEKNRKAASKCRSKQKKQQEDLVEQAREVQVRNKCLKAEVNMLKDALRSYMEHAGRHQNCPDSRLAVYLQREADRLAAGLQRTSASPVSPTSLMQMPFTPTIESMSEHRATSYD